MELALTTGLGVVSHQVIEEFLNVATGKFAVPLSAADCRVLYTEDLQAGRRFDALTVVDPFRISPPGTPS